MFYLMFPFLYRQLRRAILLCLMSSGLLFIGCVLASISSIGLIASAQAASDAKAEQEMSSQLPMDDIKRFVTSVAIVQSYYVKAVPVNRLFEQALSGMIGRLDPHSAYLDADTLKELKIASSGKFTGIGVELIVDKGVLRVISPLDGSPAKKAGIRSGDLILKVNGQLVRDVDSKEMIRKIRGPKGTSLVLTVLHKDESKPVQIRIKRDTIKMQAVKSRELEPGYAYFRLAFFQKEAPAQLRRKIKAMQAKIKRQTKSGFRGVILDLRNNPGGLLMASTAIANLLLTEQDKTQHQGLIVYTKGRDKYSKLKIKMKPQDMLHGAPLIVIINGGSASASEILAGVLQDDQRAVIIGERSFGKGSVQTVFPLGDDDAIKLTTALYYTPAGREIQARGIEPDIIVPQLNLRPQDSAAFKVSEADFNSHIKNNGSGLAKPGSQKAKNNRKEFKLAQNDYQLYQGLMILKGMHTHSRY